MMSSFENFLNQPPDEGIPSDGLALRNFVTRLNQLSETLGAMPVLTPEIRDRLGHDAYFWASRGVDLSVSGKTEPMKSADASGEGNKPDVSRLAQRNIIALHRDYVGDGSCVIPPDVRENIERAALFLAERGIDLLSAPDIDDDYEDIAE